ncbi:MAG: hypothetical protein KF797_14130, partial [Flavobacteriales bacterium]|nr:hypothetical protein [Flavobacteriales bacterium]
MAVPSDLMLRTSFILALLSPLLLCAQDQPEQRSENGWYLSPHGTIRVLVLFVEIDFDVSRDKDPQPDGAEHWPKGKLPKWKDDVFDPFPMPVQQATVSRYYQDISHGRYSVLGDYIDTLIILKESEYPGIHQVHSIGTHAVKEANKRGSLRTRHGLGVADFDLWKARGKPGLPKLPGPDDPHSYDHVMVITRNSGLRHGSGSTDSGSPGPLFGHGSDTQSRFGAMNSMPFSILKHEFNHLLIGGNNFHSGGGNAAQFESVFMNMQGGWSMMGANGSSLHTCTGWDRVRMGWKPDGAIHEIRAHDLHGREVNGDIDPLAGDTGLFILRDFVPSGDALRIRIPHIPATQLQQWLWIENHQGVHRNGSPTDRFHWETAGNGCMPPIEPGLFMVMQVGREQRTGRDTFGGIADYLRAMPANGNYDMRLRGDTLHDQCPFLQSLAVFVREPHAANPLTGNHEQELPLYDKNGDGRLQRGEHWGLEVRHEPGRPPAPLVGGGMPEHAFRMKGNRVLGMGTNPSSASMMTLISAGARDVHKRGGPNVRAVHLNGFRVELMDMHANGDALVRVSINDTRLDSDVRWCGDSIVLPPLRGRDGYSLTVAARRTLLLDRSATPTRMDAPDSVARGGPWFSDPTCFVVRTGASVLVEAKGTLELRNGSVIHLMPGTAIDLHRKAALKIEQGSRVIAHGDAAVKGTR